MRNKISKHIYITQSLDKSVCCAKCRRLDDAKRMVKIKSTSCRSSFICEDCDAKNSDGLYTVNDLFN